MFNLILILLKTSLFSIKYTLLYIIPFHYYHRIYDEIYFWSTPKNCPFPVTITSPGASEHNVKGAPSIVKVS